MSWRILLIVTGGIAAYKTLEFVRRGRERGLEFQTILTKGGAQFVTPLSLSSLTGKKVYGDLFSLTEESEMGHIRLAREADLILVAPATADFLAKMAHGLADDLASATLLAADKPVLVAPAMNAAMWHHPATQANLETLRARGIGAIGPDAGDLACGEIGEGRMVDPAALLEGVLARLAAGPLKGLRALVTSGPTHEAIDPVRFIANRSSGKQGHAIAGALARAGAETILISGPTALADPPGCRAIHIESAEEMLAASLAALPVDIAICAAAIGDWRPAQRATQKLKKGEGAPRLDLVANPDILARLAQSGPSRPRLVIGFAAETENVIAAAREKRRRKACDWILANDVRPGENVFGGEENRIHLIAGNAEEAWPRMTKRAIADKLVARIIAHFAA